MSVYGTHRVRLYQWRLAFTDLDCPVSSYQRWYDTVQYSAQSNKKCTVLTVYWTVQDQFCSYALL